MKFQLKTPPFFCPLSDNPDHADVGYMLDVSPDVMKSLSALTSRSLNNHTTPKGKRNDIKIGDDLKRAWLKGPIVNMRNIEMPVDEAEKYGIDASDGKDVSVDFSTSDGDKFRRWVFDCIFNMPLYSSYLQSILGGDYQYLDTYRSANGSPGFDPDPN